MGLSDFETLRAPFSRNGTTQYFGHGEAANWVDFGAGEVSASCYGVNLAAGAWGSGFLQVVAAGPWQSRPGLKAVASTTPRCARPSGDKVLAAGILCDKNGARMFGMQIKNPVVVAWVTFGLLTLCCFNWFVWFIVFVRSGTYRPQSNWDLYGGIVLLGLAWMGSAVWLVRSRRN